LDEKERKLHFLEDRCNAIITAIRKISTNSEAVALKKEAAQDEVEDTERFLGVRNDERLAGDGKPPEKSRTRAAKSLGQQPTTQRKRRRLGGKNSLTRQNKDLAQKLATSESNTARMAAAGSETKNYGKGEMQRTPWFTDNIDSLDSSEIGGEEDRGEIVTLMKNVMSSAASSESPSSKMRRGTKEINEIIQNFLEERASRVKGGMSTVRLDALIESYEIKREEMCKPLARDLSKEY